MLETATFAAGLEECEVETEVHKSYSGYRFKRDDLAVRIARSGLERSGYEPTFTLSGGAADANVFNERGFGGKGLTTRSLVHPDSRIYSSAVEEAHS